MERQINEAMDFLRRTALRPADGDPTDGQLLARFIEHREPAAVAALVQRHGPMVWGVCRRILRSHHDAEDAFQATFLVLVRKAGSIRQREMMASWLYAVAHQTALKARAMRAKRRTRETQGTTMPEPPAPEPDARNELQSLLDQELSRLPDKYRVAIVLCDLEGKTRREAARQLGLPEGTVAGRMTRGRAILARRLARRGLAVPGGVWAAVFSREAASAAVPVPVIASTIKAASAFASGQSVAAGAIPAHVAALTERMLKAMLVAKLRIPAALVLALVLTGTGVAHRLARTQAAEAQPAPRRDPPVPGGQAAASPKPGVAAPDEKRAENLFREMEQKLVRADQARIIVDGVVDGSRDKGRFRGRLLVAKGDKLNVLVEGTVKEEGGIKEEKIKLTVISNGTKTKMGMTMLQPQGEVDTPKNFGAGFAGTISRAGMLAGLFRTTTRRPGGKEPELDDVLKLSDFGLGKKDEVGGRPVQIVNYKMVMDNGPHAENTIWLGTLWLDAETKLPLKRVLSYERPDEKRRVTETYQIRLNGKIDEKEFELPR